MVKDHELVYDAGHGAAVGPCCILADGQRAKTLEGGVDQRGGEVYGIEPAEVDGHLQLTGVAIHHEGIMHPGVEEIGGDRGHEVSAMAEAAADIGVEAGGGDAQGKAGIRAAGPVLGGEQGGVTVNGGNLGPNRHGEAARAGGIVGDGDIAVVADYGALSQIAVCVGHRAVFSDVYTSGGIGSRAVEGHVDDGIIGGSRGLVGLVCYGDGIIYKRLIKAKS